MLSSSLRPVAFVCALFACANLPAAETPKVTPPEEIAVPQGFKVELLRVAGEREGSWVCMAIDDKGRLYISPQGAIPESGFDKASKWGGIWRVTLNDAGKVDKWEKVPVPIGSSMGMLWAWNRLYVSGSGPEGRGIYTLTDSDGDDTLDAWKLFKKVEGGDGEHGAHAMVVGPDGHLYIAHGNSTPLVEGISADSPYRNYAEDYLLPRIKDPVATFFDNLKAPYGYVLRTDRDGTKWELYAGGFRNHYDIDFNTDGELFTYDSDMEWDVGLPWYRPTRILHIVPGGEYGFREGNHKWPEWREDTLPPVVNIGLGSPTGIKFGTKSNFPEKYRRALFAMDWTYGRIIAVHMHPRGSGYTAKAPEPLPLDGPGNSEDVEDFLKGKGLPVSDLEFGKDGAMYFIIGGRGTQSALYRVSWSGAPEIAELQADKTSQVQRTARRATEAMPGIEGTRIDLGNGSAWGTSDNRFMRFAQSLALQRSSIDLVRSALAEIEAKKPGEELNARAALTALLALVRVGTKEDQVPVLKALARFPLDSLSDDLKLLKFRVINLSFVRQGRPEPALVKLATEKLLKQYPAKGPQAWPLNYELSELLIWLTNPEFGQGAKADDPAYSKPAREVIARTLALLEASPTQQEQIWFATVLAEANPRAWTPEQRTAYWKWWAEKAAGYQGGNSFGKFVSVIRERALSRCTPEERKAADLILAQPPKSRYVPPVRPFVKAWSMTDLEPLLAKVGEKRDLRRGKAMYIAAQCAVCHKFKGEGGAIGPDLTASASRYNRRDLLEAIIDPNKGVSEQYAVYSVRQFDNQLEAVGMIVGQNNTEMQVLTDPFNGTIARINLYRPAKTELLPTSFMPPGLLNTLNEEEILDLLAYIESGATSQPGSPK